MTIVEHIPDEEIEDAVLVTEEEKKARMQEQKDAEYARKKAEEPGGLLLIHVVKPDGTPVEGGIQFTLNQELKLVPQQALAFIKAFSASKLPDGKTLVVTAHLADGTTRSEVYTFGNLEEYDEDAAIEFCKNKILHDVFKLLEFVWTMGTFTPDKEKENDELASKLAEAVGKKEEELDKGNGANTEA